MAESVDIQGLAARLDSAQGERVAIEPLTAQYPGLHVADAYAIQGHLVDLWVARGDRIVGVKAGLTSQAKQQAMGVHEPIYGYLCESMVLAEGEPLPTGELIHPRAEPEIAFILKSDLQGPGVTPQQVLAATEGVAPAFEVIDSRYRDFRFTLPDVIADNASSARLLIGAQRLPPFELDLRLIGMVFEKNGEVVETGAGAAVLGDPLLAVAWLANALAGRGERLEAGWIVLPGALCNAHPVAPGDELYVSFDRLGTLSLRCV